MERVVVETVVERVTRNYRDRKSVIEFGFRKVGMNDERCRSVVAVNRWLGKFDEAVNSRFPVALATL
jgi:hypothetical protein